MKYIFPLLILLQVILPQFFNLPGGWGMFSKVTYKQMSLVHKGRGELNIYDYVQKPLYIISEDVFKKIVKHICKTNNWDNQLIATFNNVKFELKDCEDELSRIR